MLHALRLSLVAAALATPAVSQTLDDKIDAASQRWQFYQERLGSADPIIRAETLTAALRDDNEAIRSGAIWYALRGRSVLSVALVVPPGSAIDVGLLPILDVSRLEWDRDHRTVNGSAQSRGIGTRVSGEVVGGTLRLIYPLLGMAPAFSDPTETTGRQRPHDRKRCSVALSYDASSNSLIGPFACEGMSSRYTARLPLG